MTKTGILLPGQVNDWTKEIVEEYNNNFPEAEIFLSTWTSETVNEIPCKIIQVEQPKFTQPHKLNVNHQKIGTLAGLENMSSDIIMKCRADQFIHNKNIFEIYEKGCPKNKIMITDYSTYEDIDYFASDFCQIATKEVLLDYWNSIPYYDGSFTAIVEVYLASNYIIRGKKDLRPWNTCMRDYYYIKSFHNDFQIEWKRLNDERYQIEYEKVHELCAKPDP